MGNEMRARIKADIELYGQHVVGVGHSHGDPADFLPFAYTIGNHGVNLPELLVIGGSGELHARILNIVGQTQRERGDAFRHGEMVDFTAALPARIVEAGRKGCEEYAVQAGVYYGADIFEVRQVLLPDQNGRYPGDPGCRPTPSSPC